MTLTDDVISLEKTARRAGCFMFVDVDDKTIMYYPSDVMDRHPSLLKALNNKYSELRIWLKILASYER